MIVYRTLKEFMTDRLRSIRHDGPSTRLVLEVPLNGNLDKVLRLLVDALKGNGNSAQVIEAINNLERKVDSFMATQEERLQVIATKIDEVLADLAALKASNPQIEDEIAAIEAKLSIAQPEPTPEPIPEG